jgi:hypothetical protein
MKKFFLAAAIIAITATTIHAQIAGTTTHATGGGQSAGKVVFQDLHFGQGANKIQLTDGSSIQFDRRDTKFSNVFYVDAAGKKTVMAATPNATGGPTTGGCKYPLPDACFATADKNIGMCICKPTDLTSGIYPTTLLLPAAIRVREAANTAYLKVELENVLISSVKPKEGTNTVQVPGGRGTIKFAKRGEKFSDVVFTDAAGKTTKLNPVPAGTNGAPNPGCKFPIPDACFGTADKNIGMCMCKPTDLTTGGGEVTIGLLLPAIQKVREAANK